MSSKLTVIFYIILCLEAGVVLTLLPWVHPFGLGDWGDNYFLLYASQKIGLQGLQHAMSSGWARGAVTGLGLLNLGMAFWEMAHFRSTVRSLQAQEKDQQRMSLPPRSTASADDVPQTSSTTDHLSHHERADDTRHHSGE
ncbi:MAG TPA: hypothetical protein VNA19_07580 [Pyrinomonadaceae bacterium]|jgi:hypothetical protein|nr:hypothetical protein [Pyrinomonadaceae bacterium]